MVNYPGKFLSGYLIEPTKLAVCRTVVGNEGIREIPDQFSSDLIIDLRSITKNDQNAVISGFRQESPTDC